MQKKYRAYRILSILIPMGLCSCASTHTVAVPACVQAAPQTQELQVPAPPPLAFSQCLTEILQVGKGERAQISSQCSQLLGPLPTE